MVESGTLNWGKCKILLHWTYAGDTTAKLFSFPIPVQDTTTLETEEGEETEATIEGGAVEAVRFDRNKYTLTFEIRTMSGRKRPIKDSDGMISGSGKVMLIPETLDGYGILMELASGRVVDSMTAADGGRLAYTFKAQVPAAGDQCKWGVFKAFSTTTGTNQITDLDGLTATAVKKITFDPIEVEGESKPSQIVVFTAAS